MSVSLRIRLSKLLRACVVTNSILFLAIAGITIFLLQATADDGKHPATSVGLQTASCETELLPQDVISDLCNKALVPIALGSCSVELPQLQRKHTETIIAAKVKANYSTHQIVKEAFGKYEIDCTKVGNFYTCEYDLSGEGPVIAISYDANTQIAKSMYIQQTSC